MKVETNYKNECCRCGESFDLGKLRMTWDGLENMLLPNFGIEWPRVCRVCARKAMDSINKPADGKQ